MIFMIIFIITIVVVVVIVDIGNVIFLLEFDNIVDINYDHLIIKERLGDYNGYNFFLLFHYYRISSYFRSFNLRKLKYNY